MLQVPGGGRGIHFGEHSPFLQDEYTYLHIGLRHFDTLPMLTAAFSRTFAAVVLQIPGGASSRSMSIQVFHKLDTYTHM
jgi:hypothetical protein